DAELGGDAARTMRRLLAGMGSNDDPNAFALDGRGFIDRIAEPERLPDWRSPEQLDHYLEAFERTGFTGGLNGYRNFHRNREQTPHLDGAMVTMPSMFIGGSADPVLVMSPPSVGAAFRSDRRGDVLVPG